MAGSCEGSLPCSVSSALRSVEPRSRGTFTRPFPGGPAVRMLEGMMETPVSLVERLCLRPDEQLWERFLVLFTPLLSRWGRRLGVPAADTEDLLQEVFTTLFRKLPEFRYDPAKSFRAWLYTVF